LNIISSKLANVHLPVLFMFKDEENCSHKCVVPNIAVILAEAEYIGNWSLGRNR